jgi:prepilin-type N-terminal cleavage/methylation domain-containing protein
MKTPSRPISRKGFTLIELLVVIAIIAVLAAAGFAVGPAMMNRAKKVSAQAGAASIATAVEQFYTEYSALPDPIGTSSSDNVSGSPPGFSTNDTNGRKLLEILAGIDSGDQNPRKIRFLSTKEAKNGRDGIKYSDNGNSIEGMYDPWGRPFYIILDYGYDERLSFTPQVPPAVNLNGRKVAVYSLGVQNPPEANARTLVKSW